MSEPFVTPFQLPVFRTVGLTLRWTLAIVLRHWIAVVLFAVVIGSSQWWVPASPAPHRVAPGAFLLGLAMWLLYAAATIVIALVTHNEVLRGPSGFDAATLGRGPWRGLGYLLDTVVVFLVPFLAFALFGGIMVALSALVGGGGGKQAVGVLSLVVGIVGIFGLVGVTSRLMLRLPSRALGHPESWGDIWRMGRGNTWRLLGGNMLLWLLLVVPIILLSLPYVATLAKWTPKPGEMPPEPSFLFTFLSGAVVPVEIILFCAFLSVAYAQLRQGNAAANAGRIEPGLDAPRGSV